MMLCLWERGCIVGNNSSPTGLYIFSSTKRTLKKNSNVLVIWQIYPKHRMIATQGNEVRNMGCYPLLTCFNPMRGWLNLVGVTNIGFWNFFNPRQQQWLKKVLHIIFLAEFNLRFHKKQRTFYCCSHGSPYHHKGCSLSSSIYPRFTVSSLRPNPIVLAVKMLLNTSFGGVFAWMHMRRASGLSFLPRACR